MASHSSFLKSYQRAKREFFWQGMKADIKAFVRECDVCQRLKNETCFPARLLQPLTILERPWLDVSMNFVEGLQVPNEDSVFVVVEKLTKYAHFIPLYPPLHCS